MQEGEETTTSSSSSASKLTAADAASLIEMRPPAAMPQGNVGTPSAYYLDQVRGTVAGKGWVRYVMLTVQISQCKLLALLIGKLG